MIGRIDVALANAKTGRSARRHGIEFGGPPQQGVNARGQLVEAERLGDVVVRAAFEADDFVGFLTLRRKHEDGHLHPGGPQVATALEAVPSWQHHIHYDEVRSESGECLFHHGVPALAHRRLIALRPQHFFEAKANGRIVFDDQDFHGVRFSVLSAQCSVFSVRRSVFDVRRSL